MSFKKILFNKITLNVLAGVILVFALIFGTQVMLDKITRHNHEITVPDLTNKSVAEAEKIVEANRMRLEVIDSVYVRRMGKGLINGPGGHIELEETKYEAAIREMKEETGLTVSRDDLIDIGSLRFQFQDGLSMIGYVFIAYKYSGTLLEETDETEPVWTNISSLDYSKMWEDDVMWLPYALEGKKLEGYFIFSGEKMIDGKVDFVTDES